MKNNEKEKTSTTSKKKGFCVHEKLFFVHMSPLACHAPKKANKTNKQTIFKLHQNLIKQINFEKNKFFII